MAFACTNGCVETCVNGEHVNMLQPVEEGPKHLLDAQAIEWQKAGDVHVPQPPHIFQPQSRCVLEFMCFLGLPPSIPMKPTTLIVSPVKETARTCQASYKNLSCREISTSSHIQTSLVLHEMTMP